MPVQGSLEHPHQAVFKKTGTSIAADLKSCQAWVLYYFKEINLYYLTSIIFIGPWELPIQELR